MVDITARVTPVFPANVFGDGGVTVDKVNGAFYIGYDYDVFWGTKGDLLVRVGIAVPEKLTSRQRELLEELAKDLKQDVRHKRRKFSF